MRVVGNGARGGGWARFVGGATVALVAGLSSGAFADDEPAPEAPAADPGAPPRPESPSDLATAFLPSAKELEMEEGEKEPREVPKALQSPDAFRANFEDLADEADSRWAKPFALAPASAVALNRSIFANFLTIRARNAVATDKLAVVGKLTAILLDRRPPTPDIERGAGFGHLSYEMMHALQRKPADLVALKWGAWLLQKNPGNPVSVREWRNLYAAIGGGTGIPGNEPAAAWASAGLADLVKANPTDPDLARASLVIDLERGISMTEAKIGAGGPILQKALAGLAPADAIPSGDLALVARFNRGVTVARLFNVATPVDYRARKASTQHFSCELPLECGWKSLGAESEQHEWSIVREGRANGTVELDVYKYRADTNYTTDDGRTVGGENVLGNMKQDLDVFKPKFTKIRRCVMTVPRMSKHLPPPKGFEVLGILEGRETRVRSWYFRGEVDKFYVYNVVLIQRGGATEKDPEVPAVLESMREGEK